MELSVVILNYKVPYHLLMCLDSVTKATEDLKAEIIVVDNHSEDESINLVKHLYPEVKVISNEANYGFSKGNNIGVEVAKGSQLMIDWKIPVLLEFNL